MRTVNPVNWRVEHRRASKTDSGRDVGEPILTLVNKTGNHFHVHTISDRLVRVIHKLPRNEDATILTERHRHPSGRDGVAWETMEGRCSSDWVSEYDEESSVVKLTSPEGIVITVDFASTVKLSWHWPSSTLADATSMSAPFLADFKFAYPYDKRTGRMYHYLQSDLYLPLSEDAASSASGSGIHYSPPHERKDEFFYGTGETRGGMLKCGRRFTIDARDSLAYDVGEGDPLYKLCPFYLTHNARTHMWHGIYYNTLVPSTLDFGAEHDFSTGTFRSFDVESGPLDYYVLLGSSSIREGELASKVPPPKPRLKDIIMQFATLVTPYSPSPTTVPKTVLTPHAPRMASNVHAVPPGGKVKHVGSEIHLLDASDKIMHIAHRRQPTSPHHSLPRNTTPNFRTSPSLPRLTQFGYLASSLTLSERADAQAAVIEYITTTRRKGFAVDGMHLSSGYCLDRRTDERMYFIWNTDKYPDPSGMGMRLEGSGKDEDGEGGLGCQVAINVKPWLLTNHPWYFPAAQDGALMLAASDLVPAQNPDRVGPHGASLTEHWSAGMGETAKGSYIDFSSLAGAAFWRDAVEKGVLRNNITGLWIDNNEFSNLIDGADRARGEVELWAPPGTGKVLNSEEQIWARQVEARMGWDSGEIEIGAVGRAVLTMGMAKATYEQLMLTSTVTSAPASARPAIITRSAVPGIQAYAHATWSGDNATTWAHLASSTALTLSAGLSFLPGLYGHDVGGFAGAHAPSGELLVRWCWQAAWHTRFTVHSWKSISTTLFMYDEDDVKDGYGEVGDALRRALSWRYALIPTIYSLYVRGYHRRGWPVLRPLLWNHSRVKACLGQDAQFLVGDSILVAPCVQKGAKEVQFILPHLLDPEDSDADPSPCWWHDLHGARWLSPPTPRAEFQVVTLPAPLDVCPTLIRENGILVLAGRATESVLDVSARTQRIIRLFPPPLSRLADDTADEPRLGQFTLIEDDGVSNEASESGIYDEFLLSCSPSTDGDAVRFGVEVVHARYGGTWSWVIELPEEDNRRIDFNLQDASGIVHINEAPTETIAAPTNSNYLQLTVKVTV